MSDISFRRYLKAPKSTRPLRGVEMYQKMYPAKIKEGAAEDSETVSSSKNGTVLTTEELKDAEMALWQSTARDLYAAESEEGDEVVEDATAAENTRCRAGEVADSEEKTPEYYQFAIDQIGAIFAKVQEMTFDQIGWFGFTILGGPMPRRDGQISTKTICFGQSENGLDFAASLPTFNENVKGPFQSWLKRVFRAGPDSWGFPPDPDCWTGLAAGPAARSFCSPQGPEKEKWQLWGSNCGPSQKDTE
ncbi:hypothetical protein B0H14DRAFT_3499987 [Mycena olivaceomarginata]|nr:hypothetical protein B0H14DRAFT_3499987 [Mycena olivaceomarginata]